MLPRFISATTQQTRALERVIRTSSACVPVIPLQPPPVQPPPAPSSSGPGLTTPEVPDAVLNYDGQDTEHVTKLITDLIKQVMAEMGIESAAISRKKKKRAPPTLSLEIRSQQSLMTREEDAFYKVGGSIVSEASSTDMF